MHLRVTLNRDSSKDKAATRLVSSRSQVWSVPTTRFPSVSSTWENIKSTIKACSTTPKMRSLEAMGFNPDKFKTSSELMRLYSSRCQVFTALNMFSNTGSLTL